MKAVVFAEHGGPEKLHLVDITRPVPGPGEVLVRVSAVALNHLDIWMRRGLAATIPMPHISGCDVCGVVEETGPGVDAPAPGTRVIVAPGQSGAVAASGEHVDEPVRSDFVVFGFHLQGGYAEYCVTAARHAVPVSDRLPDDQWAALPLVHLTAYHMLHTRGALASGERIIVHGCGSGLGIAAIQLAKLHGARVMATSRSDWKLERAARELGADATVNIAREDLTKAAMDWTGGAGVDLVFDHVGPALWELSMAALRRGGRIVNAGATSGPSVSFPLRALYMRSISIHGCYLGSRWELNEVVALAESGHLQPVVDVSMPLDQARQAQERMERDENFGKIVLLP